MKYYVYHLIDPRTGAVFYIGKGIGNRIHQHEKDAKRGALLNVEKENLILDIINSGYSVSKKKIKTFDKEQAAYHFEKCEIDRIGIENLTNMSSGRGGDLAKSKEIAERFIELTIGNLKKLNGKRFYQAWLLMDEMKETLELINEQLRLREA